MPHRYEFDRGHRILLAVVEGDLQDAELLGFRASHEKHIAKFDPSAGITDFSGVTAWNVSGEAVRSIAGTAPSSFSSLPWFFVAERDLHYGMARMYQIIASDTRPKLQVVRSLEEALRALGVEHPKFESVD